MVENVRAVPGRTARKVALALAGTLLFGAVNARAVTQYLADGAKQDTLTGAWVMPAKGACYPTDGASITTRPECVATMFPAYATSAACGTALGSFSSTTSVCFDGAHNTALACVSSAPSTDFPAAIDRKWSNGACMLTMKGYDRNKVVCANQGGTYGPVGTVVPSLSGGACFGAWVMPDSGTYTPPLLNRTGANPSVGDQCLRCHRTDTQWNSNRVRDVDPYLNTGHKNIARKVTPGTPQIAPGGVAYPTDSSGNAIDWIQGRVGGNLLFWIYDGWFEEPHLPSVVSSVPASAGKPGVSYSCGRCHTTGWTSDATINAAKEPEKSYLGITWDGVVGHATTGQVNLTGGIAGDANTASSWDLYGITCDRCHGAVVDNASHGGVPPMTAPTGYSTHNNGITGTSAGAGYCSIPGPTASAQCTAIGGTWLTTACSDGVSATQTACVAAGKTWTFAACSANSPASTVGTVGGVPQAYCSTPTTVYFTSAQCAAAGGTWSAGACSVSPSTAPLCTAVPGGVWTSGNPVGFQCYLPNPNYLTATACAPLTFNSGTLSPTWTNAYASDAPSCAEAGGKWSDTKTQRGQVITALCMQCHRQETSTLPNTNGSCSNGTSTTQGACVVAGGTWTETGNGLPLAVGPNHNTIMFPSHFHGNQYLNSPHAKFTGKFNAIATAPFGYFGTDNYQSFFLQDGEAANTGNGCTGCHNAHKSTDLVANPAGGAVKECTECHQKDLNLVQHPKGIGTPLENPAESCAMCHMPGGQHSFRINVDPAYSTFPPQAFTNGVTGAIQPANTAADGTFTKAVWVDLNLSCGQCHGGGTTTGTTTGNIASGSTTLTVANATGFASGEAVTITGAALVVGKPADFPTYVASVAGTTVTLVGKAGVTVTGARVVLNPTRAGAGYISKAALAGYAKGMHNDKPAASFTAVYGANGATVNVDASASKCSGSAENCDAYSWDWGDGTPAGSGKIATHTYTPVTPTNYTITLTATRYSVGAGTATQKFTAYPVVNRPAAAGNCVLDYTAWTASCTSTGGTPDAGFQQLVFNWGDGTVLGSVTGAPWNTPVVHTFLVPGNYQIRLKVIDTRGQQSTATLATTASGSFGYFTISGHVLGTGGTPALGAAQIQIKKNGTLVKSTMSAADGSYTTGNLKPGTYTLTVTKGGYTFNVPAATVTIGPSKTPDIWAIAP